MKNTLLEKLEKVQAIIRESEMGVKKIERLSAETRKAFDNAIKALAKARDIDIKKEIQEKKSQLRQWRISIFKTIWPINFKYVLSMPFIYGMIVPFVLLHLGVQIYQQVCFRIYRIPRVKSKDYFIYDRHLLPYLNWLEKINCIYCSYGVNILRFSMEVAARTERYWCPIKYAKRVEEPHSQYEKFVDYLDAKDFREKWEDLRDFSDIVVAEAKVEKQECDFKK